MEQNMNKFEKRSYRLGYGLGTTICVCAIIAIIALTVKLLLWLF